MEMEKHFSVRRNRVFFNHIAKKPAFFPAQPRVHPSTLSSFPCICWYQRSHNKKHYVSKLNAAKVGNQVNCILTYIFDPCTTNFYLIALGRPSWKWIKTYIAVYMALQCPPLDTGARVIFSYRGKGRPVDSDDWYLSLITRGEQCTINIHSPPALWTKNPIQRTDWFINPILY